ncbi:hypothetical protein V1477_020308 [Vespula maculifrons]|uniref:Uncharacterized protein n=3 Tax=Vespula TaxID=7451 RepID=A0A834K9V8_VESVU|nr:hypothetical protein HZH66_005030 [Vespula vulgaris]
MAETEIPLDRFERMAPASTSAAHFEGIRLPWEKLPRSLESKGTASTKPLSRGTGSFLADPRCEASLSPGIPELLPSWHTMHHHP